MPAMLPPLFVRRSLLTVGTIFTTTVVWTYAQAPSTSFEHWAAAHALPLKTEESQHDLQPILSRLPEIDSLSAHEHEQCAATINHIIAVLQRHRPSAAARTLSDYEWAMRDAFVARDAERTFQVTPTPNPPVFIAPEDWESAELRNRAMADNVRWVVQQEGSAGRVFVFAHNGHVKNAPTEGGIWSAFLRPPTAMGVYLRQTFGKEMVIIGTSSTANPLTPSTRTPDSNSVDDALARVGLPLYMVDFRAARADRAANEWLSQTHMLRANFTTSMTFSPSKAFDALVFIDTLTKAHLNQQVR